jgi:hypothetical protein
LGLRLRERERKKDVDIYIYIEQTCGSNKKRGNTNTNKHTSLLSKMRRLFLLNRVIGGCRAKSTTTTTTIGPSLEICNSMPRSPAEMSNESIVMLAIQNNHVAREEMLRRDIMRKDKITWKQANDIVIEMKEDVRSILSIGTAPYRVGAVVSCLAGFASIPLVFGHDTVEAFNKAFVTMEAVPESDLATVLEVGSWSWNWMEPPLGTISFFLLCVQYARNQITNIGSSQSPYQAVLYRARRNKLSRMYPRYDRSVLNNFCETLNITHLNRTDGLDDGFSLGSSSGDIGMSAARTSAI